MLANERRRAVQDDDADDTTIPKKILKLNQHGTRRSCVGRMKPDKRKEQEQKQDRF